MNDPFILSAISAAITPAVTAWPIPGGASLYISVGSATYSFNTTNKTATFYANPSGNPYPSIAWYVSVNGGAYQYWSSSSSWTSGVYGPATTVRAYYVASNSSGSVMSNFTGGGYQ